MLAFAMRLYRIFVGTNNTTLEATKFLVFLPMFAPDMPVPIITVGKCIATKLAGLIKYKNKIRKIIIHGLVTGMLVPIVVYTNEYQPMKCQTYV